MMPYNGFEPWQYYLQLAAVLLIVGFGLLPVLSSVILILDGRRRDRKELPILPDVIFAPGWYENERKAK